MNPKHSTADQHGSRPDGADADRAPNQQTGVRPPRWTSWAVTAALVVLALAVLAKVRVVSIDVFHEMALFRAALERGSIPTEDIFAYTPTVSPSVHHEWAMGGLLYLFTVGLDLGSTGLVLLRFLLLTVVVAASIAVARGRAATGVELSLTAPLAIILFWLGLSPVRAHMVTFALLALLLYFLELDRKGVRWWLYLWPLMYIVWLNTHGGFVVGAGLLGLHTLERFLGERKDRNWRQALSATKHLWLATGLTLPLVAVNPYGLDYFPYLWHALLLDRPLIVEWSPIWAAGPQDILLLMFGVSAVVFGYTFLRTQYWQEEPGIILILVSALAAINSIRILPIYTVVWVCYVPAALARTPLAAMIRRWWSRHARAAALLALLAAAGGLWSIHPPHAFTVAVPTQGDGVRHHYPAGAVKYLKGLEFEGNLMTPFNVGAYVSWHLFPAVKVGLDSRYEVAYPPEFVEEGILVYEGEGDWQEFLDRHPTDAVLVPTGGPLDSLLVEGAGEPTPRWLEVYRDDSYAVFGGDHRAPEMPRQDRRGDEIRGTFP